MFACSCTQYTKRLKSASVPSSAPTQRFSRCSWRTQLIPITPGWSTPSMSVTSTHSLAYVPLMPAKSS